MRIANGLEVDDLPDGGVRVVARDWPLAPWLAVPALAAGAVLVLWGAPTGHFVEAGGGAMFVAFGAVCARLAGRERRTVDVRSEAGGVALDGRDGAGPFAREVRITLAPPVRVEVRAFPVPDGAPDLPDRGGDLVLSGAGAGDVRLARRTGPRWRADLEAARERLVARIPALR